MTKRPNAFAILPVKLGSGYYALIQNGYGPADRSPVYDTEKEAHDWALKRLSA
jgi:hypothetical protein